MLNDDIQEEIKMQKQVAMLEENAKRVLSKEALQRFGNLKTAHLEKALEIAVILNQAIQSNQINRELTDGEFKKLLLSLEEPKKEFKLTRR